MRKVTKSTFFNKKSHKILFFSALIFAFFVLITLTNTLSEIVREEVNYEVTAFEYGEGTVTKPYLIANRADLEFLREQVNKGITYEGFYFQLANDIDLSNEKWIPIGTRQNSFRGIFEGAGHTISNMHVVVELTSTSTVEAYGLFASLGGGSSKTYVRNINLINPYVEIASFSASGSGGLNIGSLAGTTYRNTEISNIIVNNLKIETTMNSNYTISSNDIQMFVGGLIGVQTDTATSTNDPGTNNYSHIRNCYVNLDVNMSRIQPSSKSYINQQALGGIVGAIRMQAIWPENCLVEGNLNTGTSSRSGFIGPIFGYLQGNSSITTSRHNEMFNGTAKGTLNITSYFNNLTIQSKQFTNSQTAADTPNNTTYRISTNTSNVGYVQGINKGLSLTAENISYIDMLNKFNSDESITDIMWQYENGKYSFKQRITAEIIETDKLNYEVVVTDLYNIGNYTYAWYHEKELQIDSTNNTFNIEKNPDNLFNDHLITVIVYDGSYYTLDTVTVKKLTLYFQIQVDKKNNIIKSSMAGEAAEYIDLNDYTFNWYKTDITGYEDGQVEANNSMILENASTMYDYRIEGINSKYPQMSIAADIEYSNRTVIFVSSSNGNNANDGLTEQTAVQTMAEAYSRFPSENDVNSNIVVLMGTYNTSDFLYSSSSTTKNNFSKNATVTGVYKGKDYGTRLYFYGASPSNNTNGRYLFADTKIMYLTLVASTSRNGAGQTYLFCQGNSLTIGKKVYLANYATTSNTNGLMNNTGAPDFHIMGGFSNYNQSDLSNQSNNGTITIQSGAFARIILGSRNTQVNSNSHNFTGTKTDPFNMKLIVDIEESTKNSNYTYDINLIVGGQTDGNMYGNSVIEVRNGDIGRLLGGSIGYSRTVPGYPSNSYIGSSKINVYNGEIDELYGGSLGRLQSDVYFYGPIDINIYGGTINNNIYGVGAGGVTGYSERSSDPYKSYGADYDTTVTINFNGGTLNGNLYGAGYGYSSYLENANQIANDGGALYGKSNITINGGTINGDVYGAGRGYTGYSGKNTLAQMHGDSNIYIKNNAVINGSIYGGGAGVSGNTETAKLLGNANVYVEADTNYNIYGAGNISYVEGTSNVYIKEGTANKDIYGGGNVGNVIGTSRVEIEGGNSETVYGGGKSSNSTNSEVIIKDGTVNTIFGGANISGTIRKTTVKLNGGTINTIYGGNNIGGTVENSNVEINGSTITDSVYGGGNEVGINTTNLTLTSTPEKTPNIYAGGKSANATNTNILINGIKANNIFGGSNITGTVDNSKIIVNSGEIDYIYGGNNEGGKTINSNIQVNGGNVTSIYGGGNRAATEVTTITTDGGIVNNIYGGGNEAGVTTTNLNLNSGTIDNVYGGSNKNGDVKTSNITTDGKLIVEDDDTPIVENKEVKMEIDSIVTQTYEWQSTTYPTHAKVTVTITNNTDKEINYWEAKLISKDSILKTNDSTTLLTENNGTYTFDQTNRWYGINTLAANGGTYTFTFELLSLSKIQDFKIYHSFEATDGDGNYYADNNIPDDSNESTEDSNEETNIIYSEVEMSIESEVTKTQEWQSTTHQTFAKVTVTITNNSNKDINTWNGTLISNGSTIFANNSGTLLAENEGTYTFNQTNRWYGNNNLAANGGSYSFTFEMLSLSSIEDFKIDYIFEGIANDETVYKTSSLEEENTPPEEDNNDNTNTDQNKPVDGSEKYTLNIKNIYGGNNEGGKTTNANITIKDGKITDVYGGGNKAPVTNPTIIINNGIITNVYGGGNKSYIEGNTYIDINGGLIETNVYGGGNEGVVNKNTELNISHANIYGSVYGGGNGITAIVYGNTTVNIDGNTVIGNNTSKAPTEGCVYGGGKAAATGILETNNSTATVNIVSATIYGNVYGGANTSVVYGKTYTNIGSNVVSNKELEKGTIFIKGTVFGGGEANASGSEIFDYSFISVTDGIVVNIDGQDHSTLKIDGSIFGSGNASSTSGNSQINISNYGNEQNVNKNISIQRTNTLTIKNSHLELVGATDRTNEYSDVLYTLSRIDEMKLSNDSSIYLQTGANLLKKVTSLLIENDKETLEVVEFDTESKQITQNVNNRIYMLEGKNLNIATNESSTSYGEINGMAFFGLYTQGRNGQPATGMYNNKYQYGELLASNDEYLFTKGSYILGLHQTNHDIKKNGFYSNFSDEHYIKIDYVTPTPEDSNFYMWIIGEMVIEYNIDLVASKYSTLGAVELPLLEFSKGNTTFSILDFNFNGLEEDITLTNSDNIPRVAANSNIADNVMSLVMKSNNTGWINKGETDFLSQINNNIVGNRTYTTENSTVVPSLLFYLYHSKNLETQGKMGTVTISLMAITKIDDLNSKTERLVINVNLSRALYNTNDYEGGITAGREYEMFVSQATNITSKSSISTYYSLFAETDKTIYKDGYHHALVSSYVLPLNTQITMIDYSNDEPKYYSHVINQTDVNNATQEYNLYGECSYNFSLFREMGSTSTNNTYNDAIKNQNYYNSTGKYASEEFIFIVDFKNTNITENIMNQKLLMELRDSDNQTIINVLGIEQDQLVYNVFANNDAIIELNPNLETNVIYKGQTPTLSIETDFVQNRTGSNKIYDTNYFDDKLGLKLTVLDSNNNQVTSATLLGFYFELDGMNYYPSMDGTTRINISEKVANVLSRIKLHTENTNIPTGTYTIRIESFASADGIYYGLESSDTKDIEFVFVNDEYGLKIDIEENDIIIDKQKGFTQDNNSELNMTVEYNSILKNPNIRIEMYRREYDEVYQNDYTLVDIKDYFVDDLDSTNNEKEYILIKNPSNINKVNMYFKNNLITGTYKLKYKLYDNDVYIGEIEKYIIIQ